MQRFLAVRQDMLNASDNGNDAAVAKAEQPLREIVVDPVESFIFDSGGALGGSDSDGGLESSSISRSSESRMRQWDLHLQSRVSPRKEISMTSSSFFAYEIEDGTDGIAISNHGIG